jgi:hypothetical protein
MILLHFVIWICGITLIITVSKVVMFPWFITTAILFTIQGSKGRQITNYIRSNNPDIYIRRSMPYRLNLDFVPAVNIMKLTPEELSEIADLNMRQFIVDMKLYTRIFFATFIFTILFIVSFQTVLPK